MTITAPAPAALVSADVAAAFAASTRENGGATIFPATGEMMSVGHGGAETFWIVGVRNGADGQRIATEFHYLSDLDAAAVAGFVARVFAATDGAADATAGSWVLEDPTPEARQEAAARRTARTGVAHVDNPDTDGPVVALDHGGRYDLLTAVAVARAYAEESIFGPAQFSTVYTGLNNAGDVINALDAAASRLATAYVGAWTAEEAATRPASPVARYLSAARVARATLAGDADARAYAISAEYVAQGLARAAA
ncbi:hypothetical protein ACWDTT_15875 [Streptosporangium sandarakinum]